MEIQASVARQVTFASHQNDVAVIADLAILNNTCAPLEDLQLKLVCEPALVAPRSWTVDRVAAKSELRLKDRKVSLEGGILSGLTERRRGEIALDLLRGDETIASWRQDFTGLAHNEWGGTSSMPELLAAFVMPNDPVVSTVLKEASEVLRRAGQTTSLEGYQSRSRQRVWQIASAIWSAVAARRLTYVEPPASFERQGQKIRTPGEALGRGLATCLDTAVLFAAAMEQAGLNPLIVFTRGHAFCGLWLQPQELPGLLSDDATELRKHEALKELLVFETTVVTQEPPGKFSQAIAAGSRQISEELEGDFIAALDIRRARQQQITPLSTVVERKEGEKVETVVAEGLEEPPSLPAFDLGIDIGEKPDTPETRLDHWKRKLLDLTKRNRLLNLKPSKTAIKLICPDPATLEDKLAAGTKIGVTQLAKLTDRGGKRDGDLLQQRLGSDFARTFAAQALDRNEVVSDMEQTDLDAGMVQLYRKAKSNLQEGGANTLFVALGVLRWKQSPDEERSYRAPLILVPVRLERRSAASKVRIVHHDDEPVFNMTLLEMLRQDFDLRMPELEGDLPKDESGVDVTLIWNIVRRAVRDVPGFEVVEETVLSTFSFAKYLMWKDLSDRTEALKQSPFVKHLIDSPRDPYGASAEFLRPEKIDEKIDPAELYMPLPADSSQIVAVHASTAAGDFVLEGPPGTGKSQTIANIIAHNLGLGRRVLFVSEKMAALEVVYQRLVKEGLGNFCLELHSTKANKKDVLNQLGSAWHSRGQRAKEDWHAEAARLKGLRDDLNGLVQALHRPGTTGISPRAAIGRVVRYQGLHRLQLSWEGGLDADRARARDGLARLRDVAQRLGMAYGEIGEDDKKAFATLRQPNWSNAWQARFVEGARALIERIEALLAASARLAAEMKLPDPGSSLPHLMGLATVAAALPVAARRGLAFALGGNGAAVLENLESALTTLEAYRTEKQKLSQGWSDQAIADAAVSAWKAEWAAAQEKVWPFGFLARRGVTGRMRAVGGFKARPSPDNDLPLLEVLQGLKRVIDATAAGLPADSPWRGLESDVERACDCIKGAAALREGLARLARSPEELIAARDTLRRLAADGQDLLQPGMPIADAAARLAGEVTAFEAALKAYVQEAAAEGQGTSDLADLRDQAKGVLALQPHINTWCRWQALRREAEASGLEDLVAGLGSGLVPATEAAPVFETAYCSWIAGRLVDERPELRTFSSLAHEEKIKAFRELDAKLSKLSIDYIRARLSGDIPSPEDPNRPAPYGVLARELQKQRAHKPVRQLIGELDDIVTALTPCLLMSPLSVAQFLSADSRLFDLVVFDEASQITVWDAIGAIARGTNVIVVGDPKQMPPTNFFDRGASEEEGEEGGLGEDLESILDEALAGGVKWHRLTGHYRSRHESLIAFSNHRYYGGELVTYPSNETKQTAVTFQRVEGLYQRGKGRTNPDEAKAVVREVLRRLKDPRLNQLSIGVVTLNSEQQRLLDDLLDQERRRDPNLERFFGEGAAEPVFVKNLETVQGDQRDVILLSVGYGPDTPGVRTMSMNFGPLNKKGGERRLNVAITRATTEVVIFASFDPPMIDLTRTSAAAVRDLKHYLEFAERGPAALGEALQAIGGETAYESDFEVAVAEGLRSMGWTVHTQIGVSRFRIDLGIVHPDQPGRYLAGIECDGAAYHASPSARDRDRVRQAILENLNWRLVRIWSTDFFIDAAGTLERVDQKLRELLEVDRAAVAANVVREEKDDVQSVGAPEEDSGSGEGSLDEEFKAAPGSFERKGVPSLAATSNDSVRFARQGGNSQPGPGPEVGGGAEGGLSALDPDRFNELGYRAVMRQLGLSIIDQEGPVTFDYLATRIARAHGFRRTGGQIRRQVTAALSGQRRQSQGPGDEKIHWPEGREPEAVIPFRGLNGGGAGRGWADVPDPEKLGLATQVLASGPHGDAPAAMAEIIGLGRLRQRTREEFEDLLRRAAAMRDEDRIGAGDPDGANH